MTACTSVRGKWGGVCPDCGAALPPRPSPLASWKSQRVPEGAFGSVSGRTWTEAQRVSHATRRAAPVLPEGRHAHTTERMQEVVRIVRKHEGNRSRAARELGISKATVCAALRRAIIAGLAVPPSRRGRPAVAA